MWIYLLSALCGLAGFVCMVYGALVGLTYPWPEWACNLSGFGLYAMFLSLVAAAANLACRLGRKGK